MTSPRILSPIEPAPGIHVLERVESSGWGWSVVVVRLPSGGTLVYSPSWLDGDTLARVEAFGAPRVLCAPNHFHHVVLERYRERWPEALAVASERAIPRLTARGHAGLRPLEEATPLLPAGARWLQPEGTKTGETWLSLPHAAGRTLLVCDAFFNVTRPTSGLVGFGLRRLKVVPGLRISTTYRVLGVSDVGRCRASTIALVREAAPTEVVFSHGEIIRGADCAERLVRAVEERWAE